MTWPVLLMTHVWVYFWLRSHGVSRYVSATTSAMWPWTVCALVLAALLRRARALDRKESHL